MNINHDVYGVIEKLLWYASLWLVAIPETDLAYFHTYANEPETTLKQIQIVLELFQCFISVSFRICECLKQNCFVSASVVRLA